MTKIIFGLRKGFLKKDLGSLNVMMEVMITHRFMLTVTPATNGKPPKLRIQKMRVLRRVLRLSLVSARVARVCFKIKLTKLKQKDCPMIGTHQFMFFLKPPLPSSTSKDAEFMFLSAVPNIVRER